MDKNGEHREEKEEKKTKKPSLLTLGSSNNKTPGRRREWTWDTE
jgi:hypothetical protein